MLPRTKALIIGFIYLIGMISGAWLMKKMNPPKPLVVTESAEKQDRKIEHFKTTIKKKDGTIVETEGSVEQFLSERSSKRAELPPPIKPDNLKINFDSTMRPGLEIKPYEFLPLPIIPKNLWIGYEKDLKTGEDIGTISYSTRLSLWP